MIYECFYFFNELDLLDLKLHELCDVVDKFVLLEFKTDLLHRPQPLYYAENKERFKEFEDKIIHLIIEDDMPGITGFDLFVARKENYMLGLKDCSPQDIIISSDPDLVFKKDKMIELSMMNMNENDVQIVSDWYCYYMDYLYTRNKFGFTGASYFKNIVPGGWRTVYRWKPVQQQLVDAGYHFSKLGGIDKLLQNIEGYPHQELNNDKIKNREALALKIENGYAWDALGSYENVLTLVPFDANNYPKYISERLDIFRQYFKQPI